jgi:hypothetical protein
VIDPDLWEQFQSAVRRRERAIDLRRIAQQDLHAAETEERDAELEEAKARRALWLAAGGKDRSAFEA